MADMRSSYPPPHRTSSLLLPTFRLSLYEPSLYWHGPDFFKGTSNPFCCISSRNSPTNWSTRLGSDACLPVFAVKPFSQFVVLSCSVRSSPLPVPCSSYCCFAAENALSMPYVTRDVLLQVLIVALGTQDCLQETRALSGGASRVQHLSMMEVTSICVRHKEPVLCSRPPCIQTETIICLIPVNLKTVRIWACRWAVCTSHHQTQCINCEW